jgi:hypothetical protein
LEDKIIITNREALMSKYGDDGFTAIGKAIAELADADKKRGIESKVVYLDDQAAMKKMGGKGVVNALDPRQNKEAIDVLSKSSNPQYLLILGSPDVVPHQDLSNPAYTPGGDDDVEAFGDLPYACDTPYSRDPARFVGPTRVVGRLPDLFGAKEPSYLISLLKTAAQYKMRSADDYTVYLGLSAGIWQGSTRLSLNNIFGNADKLLLAPPSGPNYPNRELRNSMHFINCHGAPAKPAFYGQRDENDQSFPESLTTQSTNGAIVEGTVAAVECCYGAQLYDSVTLGIDMPICQSYLQQGAYGYFGSTTIAYGPENTNAEADLICQYFLLKLFDGASLGHAALMARQLFVRDNAQTDPINLKTLAQYCLLGDPSLHPIAVESATEIPTDVPKAEAERFFRAERRQKMKLAGDFLTQTKATASKRVTKVKLSSSSRVALSNIAKRAGLDEKQTFIAFAVKGAPGAKSRATKLRTGSLRYHIAIGAPEGDTPQNVKRGIAVVAKELNGSIMGYRIYRQR